MTKRKTTEVLSVSLPVKLKKAIQRRAEEKDIPVSQLVKETMEYQLWEQELEELQKVLGPVLAKIGIKTDDDVEEYFG